MIDITKFSEPTYERCLLTLCTSSLENYYEAVAEVSSEDFLCIENRIIFNAITQLVNEGCNSVTAEAVITTVADAGAFTEGMDATYIRTALSMPDRNKDLKFYTDKIRNASVKYQTARHIRQQMEQLEDKTQDADSLLSQSINGLLQLNSEAKGIEEGFKAGSDSEKWLEELKHPIDMVGIPTGHNHLDSMVDGLPNGTLTVVAARMKAGKSAFLLNIANHIGVNKGIPVLYIDTEMRSSEWNSRLYAINTGVDHKKIQHRRLNTEEFGRMVGAAEIFRENNIIHVPMTGFNIDKVASTIYRYKMKEQIGLVIFDYIKAPASSFGKGDKEYQVIGNITTQLKDIAIDLDMPILTAAQMNRSNDLADSDKIARYADVVAIWSRRTDEELDSVSSDRSEALSKVGTNKLVIKYSRNSRSTGEFGIGYHFFGDNFRIREAPEEYQQI